MPLVLSVGGKILSNMRATRMAASIGDQKESCPRLSWFQPSPQCTHNKTKWRRLLTICTFPLAYHIQREKRKEKVWETILQATRSDKEGEDVLQVTYQTFLCNPCLEQFIPCSPCTWPSWNKHPSRSPWGSLLWNVDYFLLRLRY